MSYEGIVGLIELKVGSFETRGASGGGGDVQTPDSKPLDEHLKTKPSHDLVQPLQNDSEQKTIPNTFCIICATSNDRRSHKSPTRNGLLRRGLGRLRTGTHQLLPSRRVWALTCRLTVSQSAKSVGARNWST